MLPLVVNVPVIRQPLLPERPNAASPKMMLSLQSGTTSPVQFAAVKKLSSEPPPSQVRVTDVPHCAFAVVITAAEARSVRIIFFMKIIEATKFERLFSNYCRTNTIQILEVQHYSCLGFFCSVLSLVCWNMLNKVCVEIFRNNRYNYPKKTVCYQIKATLRWFDWFVLCFHLQWRGFVGKQWSAFWV